MTLTEQERCRPSGEGVLLCSVLVMRGTMKDLAVAGGFLALLVCSTDFVHLSMQSINLVLEHIFCALSQRIQMRLRRYDDDTSFECHSNTTSSHLYTYAKVLWYFEWLRCHVTAQHYDIECVWSIRPIIEERLGVMFCAYAAPGVDVSFSLRGES